MLKFGFDKFDIEVTPNTLGKLEIDIDIIDQLTVFDLSNEGLLRDCNNTLERIEVYKKAKSEWRYLGIMFRLEYGVKVFCLENNYSQGLNIKVSFIPISIRLRTNQYIYLSMIKLWSILDFVPLRKIELKGEESSTLKLPYKIDTTYVDYEEVKKDGEIGKRYYWKGDMKLSWK